jgi:hypothetical protein
VNLHLAGTGIPMQASCIPAFRAAAAADRVGVHRLCDDPVEADAIVFTECHLVRDRALRPVVNAPLTRRFPHKTLVYDERDRPWCSLPGVYVSMPARHFDEQRQRACAYYSIQDPTVGRTGVESSPDLLFSLMASPTHHSRRSLFELDHPRGVVERVDRFVFFDPSSHDYAARRDRFGEMVARSKFVLCPRGRGTSSIRLYETMAAGRVPVVIADDWVPPSGPHWDRFILRWPEGVTDGLLELLERTEAESDVMGAAARAAFLDWYAPDVAFHHLASRLEEVLPVAGVRPVRRGREYRDIVIADATASLRVVAGRMKQRLRSS